jgi:hypothetical protein
VTVLCFVQQADQATRRRVARAAQAGS